MSTSLRTHTRRLSRRVSGIGTHRSDPSAPKPIGRVVLRFMAASLIALLLFALFGVFSQRRISNQEEVRNATEHAALAARFVAPQLTDAAFQTGTAAHRALDASIRSALLDTTVVRVKIWRRDGTIAYSDATSLVGKRYALDSRELATIDHGTTFANISDLSEPENELERPFGKLLQVYLPARTTTGQPLLFEIYERYQDIAAGGRRLTWLFAVPFLLSVLLLWAAQGPLAWSLARRLRSDQRERERLLLRAIETSNLERRRIAADLHDGVVQQLAGTAYNLAAAADVNERDSRGAARRALEEGIDNVRQVIRQLRSLVVEIHPPNLRSSGLQAAIGDLTSQLGSRGIAVHLDLAADIPIGREAEEICFRAAQEGVRNVLTHSHASNVTVRLLQRGARVALIVADDGRGFDASGRALREQEGHMGLALLGDLAADMGGVLTITSSPGEGFELELEVPWT